MLGQGFDVLGAAAPRLQIVQLGLNRGEPTGLFTEERLPHLIPLHHAQDKHQQLELRGRHSEDGALECGFQERGLDRKPVDGSPIVTQNELIVYVDMQKPSYLGIVPEIAFQAGKLSLDGSQRSLESELPQDA